MAGSPIGSVVTCVTCGKGPLIDLLLLVYIERAYERESYGSWRYLCCFSRYRAEIAYISHLADRCKIYAYVPAEQAVELVAQLLSRFVDNAVA
jgi:hypothetical protein